MPGLNSQALQQWAKGKTKNSVEEHEVNGDDQAPEADAAPPPAKHNKLWAGEADSEKISPEDADELMTFLDENEAPIYDTIMELAEAAASGDDDMIAHSKSELDDVEQQLGDEYPEFDGDQRAKLGDLLLSSMADATLDVGSPEFNQAVAKAIVEARSEEQAADEGGLGWGDDDDDEDEEDEEEEDEDDF